jgi:hypothetical protein
MTHEELSQLHAIAQDRFRANLRLIEWLQGKVPETQENAPQSTTDAHKGTRTLSQNSALHLDCKLIAEKLNDAGKDMKVVLKQEIQIPWSTESVKEYIFKPIMKALYYKESTTELKKIGEIEKIHDVIMRELGEKHGIEYHDFPSNALAKDRLDSMHIDVRNDPNYPDAEDLEVKF